MFTFPRVRPTVLHLYQAFPVDALRPGYLAEIPAIEVDDERVKEFLQVCVDVRVRGWPVCAQPDSSISPVRERTHPPPLSSTARLPHSHISLCIVIYVYEAATHGVRERPFSGGPSPPPPPTTALLRLLLGHRHP